MALFVERRNGSKARIFPLAVIEGEALGMTIRVRAPGEFKEFYPFILAGFFQEVGESAGKPRMLSDGDDAWANGVLDGIISAGRA